MPVLYIPFVEAIFERFDITYLNRHFFKFLVSVLNGLLASLTDVD